MVYNAAADTYQPFMMPKFLYDRYKPDPFTFPHNLMFVVVTVGWSDQADDVHSRW
jgi:hypothetical protein